MQPAVHATTRTPGPSTVAPVVKECRNPTSPLATAARISDSGTCALRFRRRSNGLLASSGAGAVTSGMTTSSVKGPVDDVQLLLAREAHEVHRVAGDADGEAQILLRMIHGVEQRVPIQHVHVH